MPDLETREELEKQMDELAGHYAETYDEEIKAEIRGAELAPREPLEFPVTMEQHRGYWISAGAIPGPPKR